MCKRKVLHGDQISFTKIPSHKDEERPLFDENRNTTEIKIESEAEKSYLYNYFNLSEILLSENFYLNLNYQLHFLQCSDTFQI